MILGTDDKGNIVVYPFVGFSPVIHEHHYSDITNLDEFVFPTAIDADKTANAEHTEKADKANHAEITSFAPLAQMVKHSKWAENCMDIHAPIDTTPVSLGNGDWDYTEIWAPEGGKSGDMLIVYEELPNGIRCEWQEDNTLPIDSKNDAFLFGTGTDTPVYCYKTLDEVFGADVVKKHWWAEPVFWAIFTIYFSIFGLMTAFIFVVAAVQQYKKE